MPIEHRKVVAVDIQGLRHLAQLHLVTSTNGLYLYVSVSTACIPTTTKAEGLALDARPFDLPMIRHGGLTLVSYQRVALSTLSATCMVCMAHAASIP